MEKNLNLLVPLDQSETKSKTNKKRYKPRKYFSIPKFAKPEQDNYVGHSNCRFHYGLSPVDLVRASRQYMYDVEGNEFLDCVSIQAPAGHCHPQIVMAAQNQMATLAASFGFMHKLLPEFSKKIVETLPPQLSIAYLVNSGSEANDLALRLAGCYTQASDVICQEGSYHGNTYATVAVSAKTFKKKLGRAKHVHVLPFPDTYRNPEVRDAEEMTARATAFVDLLAQDPDSRISAFISESTMTHAGMTDPPTGYLKAVYDSVRRAGGVCIADEVQTGLGRVGETLWAFQQHDVVPDIVTIGKPLGNGQPVAAVITTPAISEVCPEFSSTFGGNPVSCAVGLMLFKVIKDEKLLASSTRVGNRLKDLLLELKRRRRNLGDVRGRGLAIGVEIVEDEISKKPASRLAEEIVYRMKERRVLVGLSGIHNNVVTATPPLCFTLDNARDFAKAMDDALGASEAFADGQGVADDDNDDAVSSSSEEEEKDDNDNDDETRPRQKRQKVNYSDMD